MREWVNVWTTSSKTQPVTIELFTPTVNGIRFPGRDLFPMLGVTGEISAKDLTRLVKELSKAAVALERLLGHWSGVAKAKAEAAVVAEARAAEEARPKTVAFAHVASRDIKGRVYYKDAPVKASGPQDSLSALKGGWLKEEMEKSEEKTTETEQTAGKTEKQAQTQTSQADNRVGNAGNCNDGVCNWYDAKAYCGGQLPSVAQLQAAYRAECTGGRTGPTCGKCYWSSDELRSGSARIVTFSNGGVYNAYEGKSTYDVRCR